MKAMTPPGTQTVSRPQRDPDQPDRHISRVVVLAVLALAVLAVGVVGVKLVRRPHAPSAATPVTSPPPVTPSIASGAPAAPTTLAAPALATTGAQPDWSSVVRSFLDYQNWLSLHPDPARLADIYDGTYSFAQPNGDVFTLASMQADLAMLARGDIRFDPAPTPITAAVVTLQNRDARSASVFVRFNPKAGDRTVTRDGQVRQFPDQPGSAVVWRMVLGDDGRWRLAGVKPA